MKRQNLILAALPLVVAVGCSGSQPAAQGGAKDAPKAEPTTGAGLKALEKTELRAAKPPIYRPKMKGVEPGDTLLVKYRGYLKNGSEFDANMSEDFKLKSDRQIFSFRVGEGSVVKGWDEGFLGMYPGARRRLGVPYAMGYGIEGRGEKIPGKTDLYFDVELVDVVKNGEEVTYYAVDKAPGSGATADKGKSVTIDYVIRDMFGNVLEDTVKIKRPVSFKVGNDEVKQVADDAVRGMKVGGRRDIWIPPTAGFRPPTERGGSVTTYFMEIYLRSVR